MTIENNPSKKRKKDVIYEQAALLFREKGYKAASMRDLAERVSLKVSSLYSHIGSKEELLQKICFDNANLFIQGIEKIEKKETDSVEKIKAIINLHVDIAITNPTSVTVFSDEWRHLTDEEGQQNLTEFLNLRKAYETRFKQIIITGIEQKELKEVDATVALYTILTSVRWLHYWYKPSRKVEVEALKNQMADLLLGGLRR